MSYGSAAYACALAEIGTPRWLRHCQGWVLIREIPRPAGAGPAENPSLDAVGCYPLFTCRRWSRLEADLAELRADGLVSVTLVVDPWGDHRPDDLRRLFPDLARPFKRHYVTDLRLDPQQTTTAHHRRNARRFLRRARIEVCDRPPDHLADWCRLYAALGRRHRISGPALFSPESFARQLALPQAVLLRALLDDGPCVGMQLWLHEGNLAWHHLSAYGSLGYRHGGAAYGLLNRALDHFRGLGARWASLGSGAGLADDPTSGLSRFKQGWASGERWSWLCGAVLNAERYRQLSRGRRCGSAEFFPAYRSPADDLEPRKKERAHAC